MTEHPAGRLRKRLAQPGILYTMAAHDVFSAVLMEQGGVDMIFLGGFGASASLLGLPDLDFLGAAGMADQIRRVCGRVSVPVVADADTGFGGPAQAFQTLRWFEGAGASGMLIEDQAFPKRCGHFEGKSVVEASLMVEKLQACREARRNPDFMIFARTDARAGLGLDAALDRARLYVEAGADALFVEAPESVEELKRIPAEVPGNHLANMLVGGKTPIVSVPDLEAMGFRLAVAPVESLMAAGHAIQQLVAAWKTEGRLDHHLQGGMSFTDLQQVLGLPEWKKRMDSH